MRFSHDFTLSTKRCLLRRVSWDDLPFIFSASRFAGFNDGMQWDPPEKIEELHENHEASCQAWDEGSEFVFTIASREGEFIGRISIRKSERSGVWNLGFWTHPDSQGQGFMTEATQRLVAFGFEQLAAEEIEAFHASWNEASRKVLERAGMQWREHIPQRYQKRGEWVSSERRSVFRAV